MRISVPGWIMHLAWLSTAVGAPAALQAQCAMSTPVLAPPSGKIPLNPVLWLLLPAPLAKRYAYLPRVRAKMNDAGVGLAVAVKVATEADDYTAYRVEIAAIVGGPLKVELLDDNGGVAHSWSLQLDAGWVEPSSSIAKVTASRELSQSTCSHSRTRNLHFAANAWAYRILVAANDEALAQGASKAFVVPRAMEQLWGIEPTKIKATANLALGYANCFGDTFDGSGGGVRIMVLALLPNGSEQPVTRTPIKVAPP